MVDAPLASAFEPQSGPVPNADFAALSPTVLERSAQAVWMKCWLSAYAPQGAICVEGVHFLEHIHSLNAISLRVLHSPTNLQTPRHSIVAEASLGSPEIRHALRRHRAAGVILEYLPHPDMETIRTTLQSAGLRHLVIAQAAIPVTVCTHTFDHFVELRSKRERQRTRKLLRLVDDADGSLCFSVITDGAQVAPLIEECLALEQASWKGREGTAILDKPEDARFYRQLAQDLAAAGLLRLALLHDRAGQLVAFELCMAWDGRLIALKTSCSERHLDLSPGHVLALLHIRHCCADPTISLYDVTGNGLSPAPHLLRYADRQELLWRVILFAPGWRGRILQLMWQARLRLRSVKRFVASRCG